MKTLLTWIAWLSAGGGLLLMLFGIISIFVRDNKLFGVNHSINFFIMASCFFLLTITLFMYLFRCQCKKE